MDNVNNEEQDVEMVDAGNKTSQENDSDTEVPPSDDRLDATLEEDTFV